MNENVKDRDKEKNYENVLKMESPKQRKTKRKKMKEKL